MGIGYKIFLATASLIAALTTIIYFIIKPSDEDLLTKNTWCVDKIYFKNRLVGPKSLNSFGLHLRNGYTPSAELVEFRKDGDLSLPGVNSTIIYGKWKFNESRFVIVKVDSLKDIYDGAYKVDISGSNLILKSKQTIMYAHMDQLKMPQLF